jgi:hypothetical protein
MMQIKRLDRSSAIVVFSGWPTQEIGSKFPFEGDKIGTSSYSSADSATMKEDCQLCNRCS